MEETINMNTYIFNITSKDGVNNMIIIQEDNRETAIQKAKVEILAPLKEFYSKRKIINIFHEMEYSFNGTVVVSGESYTTKKLN